MTYQVDRPRPKRRLQNAVIGLAFLFGLALIGLFALYKVYSANLGPLTPGSSVYKEVTVAQGSNLQNIAEQLKEQQIIKSDWAFKR